MNTLHLNSSCFIQIHTDKTHQQFTTFQEFSIIRRENQTRVRIKNIILRTNFLKVLPHPFRQKDIFNGQFY